MSETRRVLTDGHWHRCLHCLYRGPQPHCYTDAKTTTGQPSPASPLSDFDTWKKIFAVKNRKDPRDAGIQAFGFDDLEARIQSRLSACRGEDSPDIIESNCQTACSTSRSNAPKISKSETDLIKPSLQKVSQKQFEGFEGGALERLKSLPSPFERHQATPLKTKGYRCGDGPSNFCAARHYIRDFFLKWSPPALLPANALLHDLRFTLRQGKIGYSPKQTACHNSRLHLLNQPCDQCPARPSLNLQLDSCRDRKSAGLETTRCGTTRSTHQLSFTERKSYSPS